MSERAVKFLLLISFCAIAVRADAQNVNIDSLKHIINSAPDDTNKVIAYRMLSGTLSDSDPRAAIYFGWKGVGLGDELNYEKGMAGCYLNLGNAYMNLAVYDSSIMVLDSALIYSLKAGDPNRIALVYVNRAATHIYLNNLDKALEDATKALPYAESSKNDDRIARVYMTLGNISYYQENWNKAIEYYKKCLGLFRQSGVGTMVGTCYMNIATSFKNMGHPDTAVYYIQKAIVFFEEEGDNERLISAYSGSALIYLELKNYAQSEKFATAAIRLAKKSGDQEQVISNRHTLGEIYFRQQRYDNALSILLPALDDAKKNAYYSGIAAITKTLSQVYHETDEDENAYIYLQEFITASDTLEKRMQYGKLQSLKNQFDAEKKQREDLLAKRDTALQNAQAARKNLLHYLLATGVLSIVVIGWLIWNRRNLKKKINASERRSRIISDLQDDISDGLNRIKMYGELASGQLKTGDTKTSSILQKISVNAKELMSSINDILWIMKPGNETFSNLEDRMVNFAYEVCLSKNIELHINKDEKLDHVALPPELRRDIYLLFKEALNLITKHDSTSVTEVSLYAEKGIFHLKMSGNGKGFEPEKVAGEINQVKQRSEQNMGSFEISTTQDKGMLLSISIPIP